MVKLSHLREVDRLLSHRQLFSAKDCCHAGVQGSNWQWASLASASFHWCRACASPRTAWLPPSTLCAACSSLKATTWATSSLAVSRLSGPPGWEQSLGDVWWGPFSSHVRKHKPYMLKLCQTETYGKPAASRCTVQDLGVAYWTD